MNAIRLNSIEIWKITCRYRRSARNDLVSLETYIANLCKVLLGVIVA
jgi:hypothetical protein